MALARRQMRTAPSEKEGFVGLEMFGVSAFKRRLRHHCKIDAHANLEWPQSHSRKSPSTGRIASRRRNVRLN